MPEDRLASIILAGKDKGLSGAIREYWEKTFNNFIYRNRFIIGKNKALLPMSKPNGRIYTTLDFMIREQKAAVQIDEDHVVAVGPKDDIEKKLQVEDATVVEQGDNIGQNILRAAEKIIERGYRGKYILLTTGDNPIPDARSYDDAISSFRDICKEGDEVYCGLVDKSALGVWITENRLERFGIVKNEHHEPGKKRPKLHKYGFRFSDYDGLVEEGRHPVLTYGNIFVMDRDSLLRDDAEDKANHLFSLKRTVIDPRNWFRLLTETGTDILKLVKGELSIPELEEKFEHYEGIKAKVFVVPEQFALDFDLRVDWWRASEHIARNLENYQLYEEIQKQGATYRQVR